MKYFEYKNYHTTFISSIFVSGLALLYTSLAYAQNNHTNLIQNPGFESDHSSWEQIEPVAVSEVFHTGSQSTKISSKLGLISQTIVVAQNTDYILEGFIKGFGRIGVKVKRKTYKDEVKGAEDWVKAKIEFNSGSATSVKVYASFYKEQGRFDDFTLTPKLSAAQSSTVQATSAQLPQCPFMGYLPITSVFDNGNDGNVAANAIDGDILNRWSSKGIGKTITFDLSRVAELSQLEVMWFKGSERIILFTVQTSLDGENWLTALSDASSTPSNSFDSYDIENLMDPESKMFRIIGGGNNTNTWNSIVELKIKGCVN